MLNQGALTDDSKAGVISLWKELQDYAAPKGIRISNETRGNGAPTAGGRGAAGQAATSAPPAPAPDMPEPERLRYVWGILNECVEKCGGYSNLDFGGAGRFRNQQQLHDAIKGMIGHNCGQHAHQVEPGLGHRQGRRVRRVDRIQGLTTRSK